MVIIGASSRWTHNPTQVKFWNWSWEEAVAELKPGRLSDVDFCCLFCFLPAMWTRELGRHGFQRERRIRNSCIKEQTQVMRTESCWQLSLWLWPFLTPKSILFFASFDIPITHNKMPSVKLVQVGFLSLATKGVIHVPLWVLTVTFQSSLQMNWESFPFLDSGLHFDTWLQRDSGHVYTSLKKRLLELSHSLSSYSSVFHDAPASALLPPFLSSATKWHLLHRDQCSHWGSYSVYSKYIKGDLTFWG